MRISDLSSDVCSSDLEPCTGQFTGTGSTKRSLCRSDLSERCDGRFTVYAAQRAWRQHLLDDPVQSGGISGPKWSGRLSLGWRSVVRQGSRSVDNQVRRARKTYV